MFNNKDPNFVMDYRKLKLVIFNDLYPDKKPVPYDILTDEVRIALSNIKSCMTNLKIKILIISILIIDHLIYLIEGVY